jgi:hypothetical protein
MPRPEKCPVRGLLRIRAAVPTPPERRRCVLLVAGSGVDTAGAHSPFGTQAQMAGVLGRRNGILVPTFGSP